MIEGGNVRVDRDVRRDPTDEERARHQRGEVPPDLPVVLEIHLSSFLQNPETIHFR
jgi:hypothetical protein